MTRKKEYSIGLGFCAFNTGTIFTGIILIALTMLNPNIVNLISFKTYLFFMLIGGLFGIFFFKSLGWLDKEEDANALNSVVEEGQ